MRKMKWNVRVVVGSRKMLQYTVTINSAMPRARCGLASYDATIRREALPGKDRRATDYCMLPPNEESKRQ
jgi:hypothetical protein